MNPGASHCDPLCPMVERDGSVEKGILGPRGSLTQRKKICKNPYESKFFFLNDAHKFIIHT